VYVRTFGLSALKNASVRRRWLTAVINLFVAHLLSVLRDADMKANNYEVVDAGETITFRGIVPRSLSQAFFLTFCTALGLLSLALVLQIQFVDLELPGVGKPNWFLLSFLSPYAGLYYWRSGDRVDTCQVKLSTNTDETENEIVVQGSEEELERMWRTLEWREKGMVKVEGLLDKIQTPA
jgi:Cofactor assembly of complex C subunit B